MKLKSSNLAVVVGVLLGASLGGIVAFLLARRLKEERGASLAPVSWRDLIRLVGPIVSVGRQLAEISKKAASEPDRLL